MSCPDCGGIDVGDVVEHKMNTDIVGIVIGFMGSLAVIRTSPTLETMSFHEWELREIADEDAPPANAEEPPTAVIINFEDYLRGVKPQGRA